MGCENKPGPARISRAAEALFNFPRAYRWKFKLTGALLALVRPVLFKTMVRDEDLFRCAEIPAGSRICEIGCGDGENYRKIEGIASGTRYTGIDINPAMIEHCRSRHPEHQWLVASVPYPFADDSFDYCIIVNVLHHLNDPSEIRSMLREARRISKNILLFEPLQSEQALLYHIKQLYWALTDGGSHYSRLHEFRELFEAVDLRPDWERFSSPLRHFYAARLTRA